MVTFGGCHCLSPTLHGCNIYLHWSGFRGKCRGKMMKIYSIHGVSLTIACCRAWPWCVVKHVPCRGDVWCSVRQRLSSCQAGQWATIPTTGRACCAYVLPRHDPWRVTRFYAHFATAQTIKAHFYSFSTSCRAHFSRFSMQKLSAEASTPDLFPLGFLKHCLGGCAGVLLAKSSKCLGVKSSF